MKRRARLLALGLLAGMALLGLFEFSSAQRRASAVFDDIERSLPARRAVIHERAFHRPPLLGPARPGDAGELYRSALDVISRLEVDEEHLVEDLILFPGGPPFTDSDWVRAERLYEKYAAEMEKLRAAVDTSGSGLASLIDTDGSESVRWEERVRPLARFLAGAAAQCRHAGRDRQALEGFVILLGMAQDTQGWGTHALSYLRRNEEEVFAEIRKILSGHRMTSADLAAFAGHLDRLEARRPAQTEADLAREIREFEYVLAAERQGIDREEGAFYPRSWRNLFSRRIERAAALREIASYYGRRREFEGLALPDRLLAAKKMGESWLERRRWDKIVKEDPNRSETRQGEGLEEGFEADTARIRVLARAAAAIAWYEEERGREPDQLSDLVPRYLPQRPLDPLDGQAAEYSKGTVSFRTRFTKIEWTPKRR